MTIDYRAILHGLPGLVVVLDNQLRIVDISDAYGLATMVQRDTIVGKSMFEVFPDNPADAIADGVRNLHASLQRVLTSAAPDTMAVQRYDVRRLKEEGGGFETRYWSVINSPILTDSGTIRYIIHKAEDVTDFIRLKQDSLERQFCPDDDVCEKVIRMEANLFARVREVASTSALLKQTNQALEEARAAAETASQAKSAFLATMSHEIRTPMNGVLGMASLLRRTPLTEKQLGYLDKIQTSGKHLLEVINDILDFSKIEAGQIELASDTFCIGDLLKESWSLIGAQAAAKGLTQKTICDQPDVMLKGDKVRLKQALLNFLGNAVKFTDTGGVTLYCGLIAESGTNCVLRLEVIDTGIGISAENQGRIFDAFVQDNSGNSRKHTGTGLGLAITRRIAQLMGGEAGVVSNLGQGSTFWMTCRLAKGQDTLPTITTLTENPEVILARGYQGRRVLIVDDEPINREVIGNLLEEVGLEVAMAVNGKQAVESVRQSHYDIALMDMQMPEMDGLRATEAIRALIKAKDLVIIAMTANAFDDARVKCLVAGMDDYISKPFNPDHLFEKILHWLRVRNSRASTATAAATTQGVGRPKVPRG